MEASEEVIDDLSSTSVVSTKRLGALLDERSGGRMFISPTADTRDMRSDDTEGRLGPAGGGVGNGRDIGEQVRGSTEDDTF